MGLHLFCSPKVYTVEGGDHFGVDAFMRCPVCYRRTENHIECHSVTPEVRKLLKREWRAGRVFTDRDQPKEGG